MNLRPEEGRRGDEEETKRGRRGDEEGTKRGRRSTETYRDV